MSTNAKPRLEVGRVTEAERDEIKALFERKNGLTELFRSLTGANREELDRGALYERLVKDMGETATAFQLWWDSKSKSYGWEGKENHRWEIDFDTCTIFLTKT